MPISDAFTTPARGNATRKKFRPVDTPTTYGAITKNLLKTFRKLDVEDTPPTLNVTLPDFTNVQFPESINDAEKKKIISKMAVEFAATLANDTARASTPKVSFRDIETQHANDVKSIDEPIKDNVDSFLQGLFQFRRVREQFRGWTSATYIVQHTGTNSDIDSDDDANEDDANKWSSVTFDLFKDFEQIKLADMKAWAEAVWASEDANLAARDGQSTTYARKALSEFIFGSIDADLQKSIQNSISSSRLWNDGPYVWATLVHHFFPSPVALKTTILHKMKNMTLAEHKHDLKAYCAALMDMNAVVNTSAHTEELVTAFLTQTNTHPSDIVRNHFNQIGIKFFMSPDESQSFTDLLDAADHLHTVTTSPALPFAASVATANKLEQNIAALAGILHANMGSMKKVVAHISQLDNKVKQGFHSAKKSGSQGRGARGRNLQTPSWKYEAPTDPNEVKEFANRTWYYCATCGRWSTTHSTNGFTHNDKSVPKHEGTSPNKNKRSQSTTSTAQPSNKKTKTTNNNAVSSLQSLKAELTNQAKSSVFDLFKAAAREQ
jgi:hypothetical protein